MTGRICCLLLMLFLLAGPVCALADPAVDPQDASLYPGGWAEAYTGILKGRAGSIRAYQEYVTGITSMPVCRPVGFQDLTGDGLPELLFLDLFHETEYGFDVGRLWIYSPGPAGVRCVLTLQPEIDDLLYSSLYLAEGGLLTVHLSDTERSWILRLRPDGSGVYAAETILMAQEDFSGEGPDEYFRNGKKISAKQFQSLKEQVRADEGTLIGSLQVEEGGSGLAWTLEEALSALSSGDLPASGASPSRLPASSGDSLPALSFSRGTFTSGQKFAVYSAPSAKSWRGAKGKAAITSGSEILVAGTDGGWILILYELDSGVTRVGYINPKNIRGEYTAGEPLLFSGERRTLKEKTEITDDPLRRKTAMGKLKKGTSVLCLAEYQGMIYVETKLGGKTARGFIPSSALEPD